MNYILSSFYILLFSASLYSSGSSALSFSSQPKLIKQTNSSLSIDWKTNVECTGYYRMSVYPEHIGVDDMMIKFTEDRQTRFVLDIQDLDNKEFYYVQPVNIVDQDTLYGDIELFSLSSSSSGDIEVYFNNHVDASISKGASPNGTTASDLENAVIDKINNARVSVDYCMYNTSKTSIVNALIDAEDRGVRVRVIYNERAESSNSGFSRALPFNVIERLGDGLMHNKFIIIDAEETDASWVMSGSTNFTINQIDSDPNHVIFIQDQSLAKAYEIEFEEMWGGDGPAPDESHMRFGVDKLDNTPHEFTIDGKRVELYFSPSDEVSTRINNAIISAESTIDAALLIFTKFETRDVLEDEISTGVQFRALVEDIQSSDAVLPRLNDLGAEIKSHPQATQLHHKYAIIDEALQNEHSKVITGSHNWTHSADIRHDENLLIIHDAALANIFQQEWEARWAEQTTLVVDINRAEEILLYPNPAIEYVVIGNNNAVDQYKILDIRGALVLSIATNPREKEQLLNISSLDSGHYIVIGQKGTETLSLGAFIKK